MKGVHEFHTFSNTTLVNQMSRLNIFLIFCSKFRRGFWLTDVSPSVRTP